MKAYRRSAMILATLFALSPVPATKLHAAPLVALEAQVGAFYSMTALPDLIPAIQSGWDLRLSMVAETTDIFAAPSGTEPAGLAPSPVFSARLRADVFGLGPSAPQNDGNLYRAWQGLGLSLLAGIRFPAFILPVANLSASASIEAGGSLRATKYTGTGLVSANPAMVAQAGLDFLVSRHISFGLRMPLEFAWKSGGTASMFGIGAAFRYR